MKLLCLSANQEWWQTHAILANQCMKPAVDKCRASLQMMSNPLVCLLQCLADNICLCQHSGVSLLVYRLAMHTN